MARFILADIVERRAERPHAVVKKSKGFSKACPIKVSSSLRAPEWESKLDNVEFVKVSHSRNHGDAMRLLTISMTTNLFEKTPNVFKRWNLRPLV